MSECTHDCSSCSQDCASRKPQKAALNPSSRVKKVIGVVSGKGGVGKSTVTAMLAVLMHRKGYKVGILDADITGPSIPKLFGIKPGAQQTEAGILPAVTAQGIKIMSINLLLQDEESPVVWRGPVIGGAVSQFWTDVCWGELDYMFIDMPPGTGDVPLTVYQSLPLDGIVIVTSPQDLVSLIVKKAYNMAAMMEIPVLGIVENMSYFVCPDCGKPHEIFGKSRSHELAGELQTLLLGKMPIDPALTALADDGRFEETEADYLLGAADLIETLQ
ncbi:MAG: Mrp/NBP35 family ATP-binding protein [Clostridia bacterium]|nr:Mrp/NBP35 family ATP-binding protein [Clostridia bacterium]